MAYLYIHVHSGLCNKLIPLLSLLRIAKKESFKIKCYWSNKCMGLKILEKNFHFLDFFKSIKEIEFISKEEFKKISKNCFNKISNHNTITYQQTSIFEHNKTFIFDSITHCISYKNDNIYNLFIPYPCKNITENKYVKELRGIIHNLNPIDSIKQNILEHTKLFEGKYMVGIHIRSIDGGFIKMNKNKIYEIIDDIINNTNQYIFLSCDSNKIEKMLLNKYKKILTLNNLFGNKFDFNSHQGIKNSICDLFLLSKCNKIIGTPHSSFSFMAWLLSDLNNMYYW